MRRERRGGETAPPSKNYGYATGDDKVTDPLDRLAILIILILLLI